MVAAMNPTTIQKAMQKAGTLTNEAIKNGSLNKNPKKRGNSGEPMRREYTGIAPKCANYNLHHSPESPYRACFKCNRLRHLAKDCRVATQHALNLKPRINRPKGNRPNQVVANNGGQGRGNNGNQARGRAFMKGAEEARQDPNIVMGFSVKRTITFDPNVPFQPGDPSQIEEKNETDHANGQGDDQGMGANGGVEGVNGNVEGVNGEHPNSRGSLPNMSGCSIDQKVKYTTSSFVGKALTWWNSQICTLSREVAISMSGNDFKYMMIEEFCPSHEMQKLEIKLWNHAMVGAGHAAYTDRFHELARLVPHLIRGMVAATEPKTLQKAVQISGALTDEAVRNRSIKKVEKRENVEEPRKDKNGRDDNKRNRTGNAFASTANPVGRKNTAKDYRGMPRNVNPVNARNLIVRACYECGSTDHVRAFMLGTEEARQDLNIMTGIEPSESGFRYKIKIASGQLVEIDKVIKGCKLEIEGHVFNIDLIPFGHGNFNVIIGMDWLSNRKAEIICHEKVVRIPLLDGKVLRVLGEKPEEKMRQLKSAKAKKRNKRR
ncbi:reverse transcriptase domain-containing protein [Tanacetum coccineum]